MKLSEFKGNKGIEVVGKLLVPITNISANKEVAKASKKGLNYMISAALLYAPMDVKEILAILNDKPVDEYECDGATVMEDVFKMFEDESFLRLFGLQG